MVNELVSEWAAVSLVLFVFFVLAVPLVLAMVGTVEGREARPLDAAVTWMRRHRAQHRRSSRRLRAQWDIQLAHAGGRYEELPTLGEDSRAIEQLRYISKGIVPRSEPEQELRQPVSAGPGHADLITEDAPGGPDRAGPGPSAGYNSSLPLPPIQGKADSALPPGVLEAACDCLMENPGPRIGGAIVGCPKHDPPPRTSIFDRLSDTDCFAAINWDIHRAVNELAVLQRDLWAGYKLPPWRKWKR